MRQVSRIAYEDAYSIIEPQINAEGVHVWPFNPVFPVDVRFLVFGGKREIRMNRHDYFELLYVNSGAVVYQVRDDLLPLSHGELFVMGGTAMHRMSEYPRGAMRAAVLYFHPDLIRAGDLTGDDVQYLMPFLVQDDRFPHVIPASTGIPAQVFELMKRTAAELPAATHRARLSVKTYLKMILVLLVNHYAAYRGGEDAARKRQRDLERLRPLFEFIDARYSSPLSVEDAAATLHMSKSNFMRFFKQVTGQPFVAYLNGFRIAKAEALLATTEMAIAEVGQAVGFCDQSYFGHVFRTLAHMTPREYKQALERTHEKDGGRRGARTPACRVHTHVDA